MIGFVACSTIDGTPVLTLYAPPVRSMHLRSWVYPSLLRLSVRRTR